MANMVKAQLEASENGEMTTETASLLTEQVSELVEVLPRSQAALMKALKTGLLRTIAQGAAGQEQIFSTQTFISKQIRAIRSGAEIKENKMLARMEFGSDTLGTASVSIPEAAMFADKPDIILQGVMYQDGLTDFKGYKPTVVDLEMYHAHTDSKTGSVEVRPIQVSDLEEEIHIKLPTVDDRPLACAFFNEDANDWEALATCANSESAN